MMPTGAMCLAYFLHAFCLKKHYLPLFDEDDDEDEDEQANMSLAAMEAALKPRVLETLDLIADNYLKLADMQDFAGLNEVWNAWVPSGFAPARACVNAKLAREVLKVEFMVDAAYD